MLLKSVTMLIYILVNGAAKVNVALSKPAFYCKSSTLSSKITDGITSFRKADIITEFCIPYAYVDISLLKPHYIHYVVVYEGPPLDNATNPGGLDYFTVELNIEEKDFDVRCVYMKKSIGAYQNIGMRVNCLVMLADTVRVKSIESKGLSIAEVEVYNLASGIPEETFVEHIGCFEENALDKSIEVNNPLECLHECGKSGYKLAAIRMDNCTCGNDLEMETSFDDSECYEVCGSLRCGGAKGLSSVYVVNVQLPVIVGCLPWDDMLRTLAMGNKDTIFLCVDSCKQYSYAAMMEGGRCECIVGGDPKRDLSRPSIKCYLPCPGNAEEVCGGSGFASLYFVGTATKIMDRLSEIVCFDREENGICASSCKAGFTGEYCSASGEKLRIRTTSVRRERTKRITERPSTAFSTSEKSILSAPRETSPLEHTIFPDSECSFKNDSDQCECEEGFAERLDTNSCIDIDECQFNSCDETSSVCLNLRGSFTCKCKIGNYWKYGDWCLPKGNKSSAEGFIFKHGFVLVASVAPLIVGVVLLLVLRAVAPPASEEHENDE